MPAVQYRELVSFRGRGELATRGVGVGTDRTGLFAERLPEVGRGGVAVLVAAQVGVEPLPERLFSDVVDLKCSTN
jgi:hypothetical protein